MPDTHLIPDWGTLFNGYIKFYPKFTARVLPAHEGMPEQPNEPEFKQGIQLQLMIQGIGMTFFTTTSTFNINAVNRVISMFRRAPQAITGQLAIYKLLPGAPVVWGDGTFYPLALEHVGWTERDENIFGARIVPPPRGRGAAAAVVGFTPPSLLPGAAEQLTPSASAPVAAAGATPAANAEAPFDLATPSAPTAPATTPAVNAGAPFEGPYTAAQPGAVAPPAAAKMPPPAAAPPDPFEIFRRGKDPVPQPIPKPRSAA